MIRIPQSAFRIGRLMSVSLLRHAVATLAYRGSKAVRGAPPEFASYRASETSRTPLEILAHVNDLLDWMDGFLTGVHKWQLSTPAAWSEEVARFHSALARVDGGSPVLFLQTLHSNGSSRGRWLMR